MQRNLRMLSYLNPMDVVHCSEEIGIDSPELSSVYVTDNNVALPVYSSRAIVSDGNAA